MEVNFVSVLLTGGSGFVGQAVQRLVPGLLAPDRVTLDLADRDSVLSYFAHHRPEVVVHAAAKVGGILANMASPADFLIDNIAIDANLLNAVRQYPVRHFIPILSTCMYPNQLDDDAYPMTEAMIENGPPPPTNAAYAAAKRTLWRGTLAMHEQYGTGYTALVPANLYGPGDHFGETNSHFLAAAVHKLEEARVVGAPEVQFLGTGRARRQYLFIEDLAQLVSHIVRAGPLDTTINVAPHADLTIEELTYLVRTASGYEGHVVFDGSGSDGQLRKDVDPSQLHTMVPAWSDFETPLEPGLKATVRWYRQNVETR